MPSLLAHTKRLYLYAKLLRAEPDDLRAHSVTEKALLKQAQLLHAQVYRAHGYITDQDLTQSGLIDHREDPYQDHAQYFAVERQIDGKWRLIAASRLILSHKTKQHQSFQTYIHQTLTPQAKALVESSDPSRIAEVSALVKVPGQSLAAALMLYRAMWHYALAHDHELWLMSCDLRLYQRLKLLFGSALTKAGDIRYFKGHNIVPLLLRVDQSLDGLTTRKRWSLPPRRLLRRRLLAFMLRGLNLETLSDRYRQQFEDLKSRPSR